MSIESIINSIYKISDNSVSEFTNIVQSVQYPKGHLISQAGKTDPYMYFLEKGIARAFTNHDGEEVTFWFGMEGSIICSMKNYIENKPSYESIELLEDSSLYRISTNDLSELYERNIEIANWGRKYIESEIIKTENRLIELQFMTATDRYHSLLKNNPTLLQRVPLGIIASYLGITQVSLSRIRAKG